MYIEPKTKIRLLKEVPLDSKYQHTLWFDNANQQYNYFHGKLGQSILDAQVQPINKGVVRFSMVADKLYNCNYMMFQNLAFSEKWFYAFITKIDYINDSASNVYYEIDVMQTWLFDIELKQCMVEREHSLSDNVGDNTVIESIDIGPIISEQAQQTGLMDTYVGVIATAYAEGVQMGGIFGGTFTGLAYVTGDLDGTVGVQTLLDFFTFMNEANQLDAIASVFTMPKAFYTQEEEPVHHDISIPKNQEKIEYYTPKNKKLLCYPYNFLYVHNSCGGSAIYRYEYFQNTECRFQLVSAMGCNPEIVCLPIKYDNQEINVDEKLTLSGFPQVGYASDSFKAWISQESVSTGISAIGSAGAIGVGAMTGNSIAIAGGVMGLASSVNSVVSASNRSDTSRGSQGNNTLMGTRQKDFYFCNRHINRDYALVIDAYFDMFGYACARVKTPNRHSRPHWNYVKTRDCVAIGECPSDDLKEVCNIYDKGVTFWKNPSEVGMYNYNNSPVS